MVDRYSLGIADISAIVIVMMISAGIGVFFRFSGGRQKTTNEFLMAGRTMSPFPVVFSLIVTFVSAITMLGIPSEVYQFGVYRLLAYVFSTVSNVISAYIFLPVYFQMGDSVSVYEYLERRFGKLIRKIASVLFIFHSLFFMSVVLVAPAVALSTVSDINMDVSIISIGLVCTIYCCMGGMKAVLWTDVFQAIVMYICVFAVMIKGILLAETTIPEAFRSLHSRENKFLSFDPTVRYTLWNCVSYGFIYGLYNYGCNQAQIQRMLSVKSLRLSKWAVFVSIPVGLMFTTICFFIGVLMYANYNNTGLVGTEIEKEDQIVPYFITRSFTDYPGLAGLCIAGIFSGSLSTISSSVNSLAAVTMEDFVRPYFAARYKIKDSKAAIMVTLFACAYGIAGMSGAFAMKGKNITYAYTVVFGITAGPILGVFSLGMMTLRANQKGVLRGLLCGLLATSTLGIILLSNKNSSCNNVCQKNFTTPSISHLLTSTANFNTTFANIIVPTASITASTEPFPTTKDDLFSATDMVTTTAGSFIPTTGIFATTKDDLISATDLVTTTTDSAITTTGIFTTTAEIFTPTTEDCKSSCTTGKLPSIMWLLLIGFGITTVTGYIASILKIRSGKEEFSDVDPALLSPFVKKWIFKSLPESSTPCSEELVKLNGHMESP